jgi:hypothetical protein
MGVDIDDVHAIASNRKFATLYHEKHPIARTNPWDTGPGHQKAE